MISYRSRTYQLIEVPNREEESQVCQVGLENWDEVVLFLVELAVDRAQYVFNLAAGHIRGDAPAEGKLIALATAEIPLLQRTMEATDGRVGVFLAGVRHDHQEFVAALAKHNIAAAKAGGK